MASQSISLFLSHRREVISLLANGELRTMCSAMIVVLAGVTISLGEVENLTVPAQTRGAVASRSRSLRRGRCHDVTESGQERAVRTPVGDD